VARATSSELSTDATTGDSNSLPAGLLVTGRRAALERGFGALAPLQPLAWTEAGLLCAPRSAPEIAAPALAGCPFAARPVPLRPGPPPDPPADMIAGWYRRSPFHASAPAGLREVVIAPGAAFGAHAHPTTAMCLAALERLPPGPALDLGCGCGILAVAWARLGRGPVVAVDLDPAALDQTARSAEASGVGGLVTPRQAPAGALAGDLAGRIVLANLPASAHHALLARVDRPPRALVASGLRPGAAGPLLRGYRRLGMRLVRIARTRRFECLVLVAGAP